VAHIKAMENDYEKLNLGIDFIRLPHFEVGFVVTGMSTNGRKKINIFFLSTPLFQQNPYKTNS
jgi:hypothetical protein